MHTYSIKREVRVKETCQASYSLEYKEKCDGVEENMQRKMMETWKEQL